VSVSERTHTFSRFGRLSFMLKISIGHFLKSFTLALYWGDTYK
jgi:hypothetical protein